MTEQYRFADFTHCLCEQTTTDRHIMGGVRRHGTPPIQLRYDIFTVVRFDHDELADGITGAPGLAAMEPPSNALATGVTGLVLSPLSISATFSRIATYSLSA